MLSPHSLKRINLVRLSVGLKPDNLYFVQFGTRSPKELSDSHSKVTEGTRNNTLKVLDLLIHKHIL